MPAGDFDQLFADLSARAAGYGVHVRERPLGPDTPAAFDGPTMTLDPACEPDGRCYYLAHALGSIAQWSTDPAGSRAVYAGLRAAKAERPADTGRVARALAAYLAFEEQSSGHAVWLLADLGHAWAVPGYTLFFRADLAAMTAFHQTGAAPKWQEFYPAFADRAARGEVQVPPFEPRPVPNFRAARIEHQDVVREEDGRPA